MALAALQGTLVLGVLLVLRAVSTKPRNRASFRRWPASIRDHLQQSAGDSIPYWLPLSQFQQLRITAAMHILDHPGTRHEALLELSRVAPGSSSERDIVDLRTGATPVVHQRVRFRLISVQTISILRDLSGWNALEFAATILVHGSLSGFFLATTMSPITAAFVGIAAFAFTEIARDVIKP